MLSATLYKKLECSPLQTEFYDITCFSGVWCRAIWKAAISGSEKPTFSLFRLELEELGASVML